MKNCSYSKIINPSTGKLVSTYGKIGKMIIKGYNENIKTNKEKNITTRMKGGAYCRNYTTQTDCQRKKGSTLFFPYLCEWYCHKSPFPCRKKTSERDVKENEVTKLKNIDQQLDRYDFNNILLDLRIRKYLFSEIIKKNQEN